VEIVAGLLRHPSPISIDDNEACETFLYVFKVHGPLPRMALPPSGRTMPSTYPLPEAAR
jgi:hypothetical protein